MDGLVKIISNTLKTHMDIFNDVLLHLEKLEFDSTQLHVNGIVILLVFWDLW